MADVEPLPMHHVVSVSGGVTSWATARIVVDEIALCSDKVSLLFADTKMEDLETYNFLAATSADLNLPITRVADGRDPWTLFADEKFIGNNRVAICSRKLKREKLDAWFNEHCSPDDTIRHIGMDWTEINRFERHRDESLPWIVRAPLIEKNMSKPDCIYLAQQRGLPLPAAYANGFAHSNCAGMCVRAGIGHWSRLYRIHPDRFNHALQKEEELRQLIGKDVSILRDRTGGKTRTLTLRELRDRLDLKPELMPVDDGGACGCGVL